MVTITHNGAEILRNISMQDFQSFGVGYITYVKPVMLDEQLTYALHSADGKILTLHDKAGVAEVTSRKNGLEPLSLQ